MEKIKEKDIPLEIRNELDNKEVSKISDVLPKAEPAFPDIEQVDVETLINKPIVIREVKFFPSTFDEGKEFVVARITNGTEEQKIINGSKVVVEKLKKIEGKFPVSCTIVRKVSEAGRKYFDVE